MRERWATKSAVAALGRLGFELHRSESRRTSELLRRRNVDVVLDVGAARGWYGTQLRRGGYRGQIISFEPLAQSFEALRRVSARDGRWKAVNKALGAARGQAVINVAANGDSSSLLPMLERHRRAAPLAHFVHQETIVIARLDDEWAAGGAKLQRPFLKLDVQGFEKEVLKGAAHTIALAVGIQIELSFAPLYEGGTMYDEALITLRDAGFVPAGIQPGFRDKDGILLQADFVMVRPS